MSALESPATSLRASRWRRPRPSPTGALIGAVFGFGLLASARAGDPVVDKLDHAEIDWTAGALIATGSGTPNLELDNVAEVRLAAEEAAKANGYQHILEAVGGVQVTVDQVGQSLLAQPAIRAQVEGVVQSCKVQDTRYYSDGGVDVVIRCPLEGGLATALAPTGPRVPVASKGTPGTTGLVIDASGIDARPVLFPTVLDPNGTAIVQPRMLSAEALRLGGAVVYVDSLAEAKAHPRAGKSPLVLEIDEMVRSKGWRVRAEEASKLAAVDQGFIRDGKVVVVVPRRARKR